MLLFIGLIASLIVTIFLGLLTYASILANHAGTAVFFSVFTTVWVLLFIEQIKEQLKG